VKQLVVDDEGTHFLNVDLEVFSRAPLDGLVAAFGDKVDVLHVRGHAPYPCVEPTHTE
jgi:hypothetical protein